MSPANPQIAVTSNSKGVLVEYGWGLRGFILPMYVLVLFTMKCQLTSSDLQAAFINDSCKTKRLATQSTASE